MQKIPFALIVILFSCKAMRTPKETLGKVSIEQMENAKQCEWVRRDARKYRSDPSVLNQMARMVDYKNFKWKVYLGCWCDDSEQLVPKFRDVLRDINFPEAQVEYYLLDLNKHSPDSTEIRDKVEYLPTFILYENGRENGRIVESIDVPMESMIFHLFTSYPEE